ncbi:hypothetical protein ACIA47_31170 [Micromonospora sp. NPDC051227]|nr:hypothetical protein [Micromonospora sp. STR1s_5]
MLERGRRQVRDVPACSAVTRHIVGRRCGRMERRERDGSDRLSASDLV